MFTEVRTGDDKVTMYQSELGIFKRFKAGLGWPESGPGYICVAGEAFGEPVGSNFPLVKVLFENHETALHELAKRCGYVSSLYYARDFSADLEGPRASIASLFNDFLEELKLKISVAQFTLPQDQSALNTALQVLRRRFKQGSLQIPREGILANKVELLNCMDPKEAKAEDFPEMVIAGSLVHEFDISCRVKPWRPYQPHQQGISIV